MYCTTRDTWKNLFEVRSRSLSGYVTTLTKLEEILQEYDFATSSKFRCLKSSKLFGKDVGMIICFVFILNQMQLEKYLRIDSIC